VTILSVEKKSSATRLPRYRRASHPPRMQITARDIRVVRAVYKMRFLTREQVQALEFGPSTASYCKRRLSLLYHHGVLDRKFIPAIGSFGSTRAIYCLTRKGAELLAHQLAVSPADLAWRPALSERELYFLQHTLAINDFRICAILSARQSGLALDWTDERTLRRREMRDYVADPKARGQNLTVVPDGYFTLTIGDTAPAFALELDRATVEEKPFKAKVRAYGEWKRTGAYAQRFGTDSLRVLFVIGSTKRDPDRLQRVKRWCEAEGGRSLFWFAHLGDVTKQSIFGQPVWHVAGRDGQHKLL
jgi:hypothetical protein